jgi:ATP-dependent helicase/nuclease subunit A
MNLTDQQRAAIETRAARICVSAGAGSGKTFVLVQRIVALLRGDADLDEIVAITFTEKAAAEMKARLRGAFRKLADPDNLDEMSHWRNLERQLDTARISTIHAFCMRLLKENALQLGLDPDFGLLSEPQSRLLVRETSRETLLALLRDDDPHMARLATEWPMPRLRELLDGLSSRVKDLEALTADWPLHCPDALATYWRAQAKRLLMEEARSHGARRQMRKVREQLERFAGECGEPDKCGREIRRRFLIEAIDNFLAEPATFEDLIVLGESVTGYKGKNGVKKAWPSEEMYEELSDAQDTAKGLFATFAKLPDIHGDLEAETATLTIALLRVAMDFSRRLDAAKAQRNALDFDDLVSRTATALAGNAALSERAAAGVKHLLMDEFQDTDHTQLGIAESLCAVPGGPQLFVVGDAKQSIYRFRGAEVGVFRDVREAADPVLLLAKNFRSAAGILHFVNDFFQRSELLGAVEPIFGELDPHRPPGKAASIEFLIAESPDENKLKAKEAREQEAALIAARIAGLCAGPPIVWEEELGFRQPRPGDIAVLLRAMSNVHLYTEALHRAGIEYGVVAGAGFYERQEVLDVLNLLKVVLDPFDEYALLAVLRSPLCGLRDDTLALLCQGTPLPPAFFGGAVPDGILDPEALADARQLLCELRAQRDLPLDAFLEFLLTRTHYEAMLLAMPNGVQAASNLRKLADLAAEFAASGEPSLATFVSYLDDMRSAVVREGDAVLQAQEGGSVTFMTVHKSKGLEFPIVILADAASGLRAGKNSAAPWHRSLGTVLTAPGATDEKRKSLWKEFIRRRNDREELDEHARLLYVGLTRARDLLIVSGAVQPGADSWLDLLDGEYRVTTRGDGDTFSGEGWQAVVRRQITAPPAPQRTINATTIDWDAIFERATIAPTFESASTAISVSELLNRMQAGLGDEEERERDSEQRFTGASEALVRGSLVHRLFELWTFSEDPAPLFDTVLAEVALPPDKVDIFRKDLAKIVESFRALPLHAQLAESPDLLREHPFVLRVGGHFVRGTIDAFLAPDTLIDYKTGHWKAESHERYVWQLRLYAAAARALTGTLPARGLLVYIDESRVEELPLTDADADAAIALAEKVLA